MRYVWLCVEHNLVYTPLIESIDIQSVHAHVHVRLTLPVLNNTEKNTEKKDSVSIFRKLIIKSITNTGTESTELCSSTRVQAN